MLGPSASAVCAFLLSVCMAFAGHAAEPRFHVPTSPSHFGRFFHVAKTGSDEKGDGSRGNPFRTINRAASALEPSDTVVVHGGVYREAVTLKVQGHPYVPEALMRFVAAEGEKVWIRGSDVFSAQWESVGEDVWRAPLPDGLFAAGSYNPFALDIDFNNAAPVRPGRADAVRGEFWIDGVCGLSRACGEPLSAVGDFHVTTDGRTVEMRFPQGRKPADCEIEISRRKQCFVSTFEGTAFYEVVGIDVGHAVEPGAFDGPRRRIVRSNAQSGVTIQRDYAAPPSGLAFSIPFSGQIARISDDSIVGAIFRPRVADRLTLDAFTCVEAKGSPDGTKWTASERLCTGKLVSYFYDCNDRRLYNFWTENKNEGPVAIMSGMWDVVLRTSSNDGVTWSEKTVVPAPGEVCFDMIRLLDGTVLLPTTKNVGEKYGVCGHSDFYANLGRWENSKLVWTRGEAVHVEPEESDGGLAEPHVAQLSDGRLVALLRAGSKLPREENGVGGVTSGKLMAVSEENGMTWSKPRFLRFDDGEIVYSPRSFQDLFVSEKNGRLYAILNIAEGPCWNCDPRSVLQIAEIDQKTLCVKRKTVTEIERQHDQHHWMVRYSNWRGVQDAKGDVLIFFELALAEQSPIRRGYDRSMYCYRIVLPSDK
ncbi:MAG: exo-alpha-sialidase [bacterium]|nr:exo-alpha-sialidase [Candidatus Colisoma equi]